MPNLDWKTIIAGLIWFLTALALGVFINLITPDRKWLIGWVRSWRANRSVKNATKEIATLKDSLQLIEKLASSPDHLLRYLARLFFGIALSICAAGAFATVFIGVRLSIDVGSLWLVVLLMLVLGGLLGISGLYIIDRVENMAKYRIEVEGQIAKLEATIQRMQAAKHPSDQSGTMKWG